MTIIVEIRGGVLIRVLSSDPATQVELFDWDNLGGDISETTGEAEARLLALSLAENMVEVF